LTTEECSEELVCLGMTLKKDFIKVVFIDSILCLCQSLADNKRSFFLINAASCAVSVLFTTKSTCLLVTKCSLHQATVKGCPSRDLTMSSHTHFAQSLLIVSLRCNTYHCQAMPKRVLCCMQAYFHVQSW
jgi:hypothetical protein